MYSQAQIYDGNAKLLALAGILDDTQYYNHSAWFNDCGTPACALGHWAHAHPESWVVRPIRLSHTSGLFPFLKGERIRVSSVMASVFPHPANESVRHAAIEFSLADSEAVNIFGYGS